MSTNGENSSELKAIAKQDNHSISPFDNFAADYDAWFDADGKLIFDIEIQAFKMLLPSLPSPWLEVGVGSGRFAQALGINTGIDPSSKLVQMARKRGINAYIGRGEHCLFDKESFGTIFFIVTLCFLDSPLGVLKETKRILMPNGKLVLGLVLKGSLWGRLYQQKRAEGHRFYRYAKFYSQEEVDGFLTQAGFVIEKTISTLFQNPGNVQCVEEPKEGYFPDAGFTILEAGKKAKVENGA